VFEEKMPQKLMDIALLQELTHRTIDGIKPISPKLSKS
jgi:hypothetical protein